LNIQNFLLKVENKLVSSILWYVYVVNLPMIRIYSRTSNVWYGHILSNNNMFSQPLNPILIIFKNVPLIIKILN
jgi:hypothetical protein